MFWSDVCLWAGWGPLVFTSCHSRDAVLLGRGVGAAGCWPILLWTVLIYITLLRFCLLGFSVVKLLFSPHSWGLSGEDTLRLGQCSVASQGLTLSTASSSVSHAATLFAVCLVAVMYFLFVCLAGILLSGKAVPSHWSCIYSIISLCQYRLVDMFYILWGIFQS